MRGWITAATAALFVAGCATPHTHDGGPRDRPAGSGDWPAAPAGGGHVQSDWGLEAYIVPPEHGGLRFYVNRPAYVAMFEIVPNGGTRLIYPTPGVGRMDGFVFSGARVAGGGGYLRGDEWLDGGFYSYSTQMSRPRFLFLIASERPLDIDAFGRYGAGMRSVLGHHYWASSDPYPTLERLAEVALPSMVEDGTWTTDLYVYWPQALRQYRASRDVLIRCNGYTMFVAYEYAWEARQYLCGRTGDQVAVNPRRPRPPAPPTPPVTGEDSTEIVQPGRRAPLPPAEEVGPRRLGSSRQLQHPQARRPEERRLVGEEITVADGAEEDSRTGTDEGTPRRPRPGDAPAAAPDPAPRAPAPTAGGASGEPRARDPRSTRPGATEPTSRADRPAPAQPPTRPATGGHEQPVSRSEPAEPQSAPPAARPQTESPTPRASRPAPAPPVERPVPPRPDSSVREPARTEPVRREAARPPEPPARAVPEAQPVDPAPRTARPAAEPPTGRATEPQSPRPAPTPRAVRPAAEPPAGHAAEPRSPRPGPVPRAVRPAAEPPSGRTAEPQSARPATPTPPSGGQQRAQPAAASPPRAAPASRPAPSARPSPAPTPARETGEAPAKRRGGGGGDDGDGGAADA